MKENVEKLSGVEQLRSELATASLRPGQNSGSEAFSQPLNFSTPQPPLLPSTCSDCGGTLILDSRHVPAVHRYGRELTQAAILKCSKCGAQFIEMEGQPADLTPKLTAESRSAGPPAPLTREELLARAARDFPQFHDLRQTPLTG